MALSAWDLRRSAAFLASLSLTLQSSASLALASEASCASASADFRLPISDEDASSASLSRLQSSPESFDARRRESLNSWTSLSTSIAFSFCLSISIRASIMHARDFSLSASRSSPNVLTRSMSDAFSPRLSLSSPSSLVEVLAISSSSSTSRACSSSRAALDALDWFASLSSTSSWLTTLSFSTRVTLASSSFL